MKAYPTLLGILYNPISIFKVLQNNVDVSHTVQSQSVFYHWDNHGKISGLSQSEVGNKVKSTMEESSKFTSNANYLIITLGTSIVYRLKTSNEIVGNCHKIPAKEFTKAMLSREDIITAFSKTYQHLIRQNTTLQILFTVSPVRHIRDGLVENNLSKAILIETVHDLTSRYDQVHYFPSYEIMLDELRDYRFYSKDFIHPSKEAVDYIWGKFCETYMDTETIHFIKEWSKIKHALSHKPFQPRSEDHQKFIKQTMIKLESLKSKIDISTELETLQHQVI